MKNIIKLALAGFILVLSANASALTLSFDCITGNLAGNCAIGESQLSVEVTDAGNNGTNNQVLFTFLNNGSDDNFIRNVYFDDGTLLGIATLIDADEGVGGDMNVDFSQGSNPPDLPGGENVNFEVTAGFLADADTPQPQNTGVNPGESLGILFNLILEQDFDDVINALTIGDADGGLRIGIHLQSIGSNNGSESFVNAPVPVPAAVWLFGSALGLLAWYRKKA